MFTFIDFIADIGEALYLKGDKEFSKGIITEITDTSVTVGTKTYSFKELFDKDYLFSNDGMVFYYFDPSKEINKHKITNIFNVRVFKNCDADIQDASKRLGEDCYVGTTIEALQNEIKHDSVEKLYGVCADDNDDYLIDDDKGLFERYRYLVFKKDLEYTDNI